MEWVEARTAESIAELTANDALRGLERRLLSILDSDERIPYVQERGSLYYNFWRDAKNRRGVWRRTTPEEYRKDRSNWGIRPGPCCSPTGDRPPTPGSAVGSCTNATPWSGWRASSRRSNGC